MKRAQINSNISTFADFFINTNEFYNREYILNNIYRLLGGNCNSENNTIYSLTNDMVSRFQKILPENLFVPEPNVTKTLIRKKNNDDCFDYDFEYTLTDLTQYLKAIVKFIQDDTMSELIKKADEIGVIYFNREITSLIGRKFIYYVSDNRLHMINNDDDEITNRDIDVVISYFKGEDKTHFNHLKNLIVEAKIGKDIHKILEKITDVNNNTPDLKKAVEEILDKLREL